jgi:hypothetical protein
LATPLSLLASARACPPLASAARPVRARRDFICPISVPRTRRRRSRALAVSHSPSAEAAEAAEAEAEAAAEAAAEAEAEAAVWGLGMV